MKTLAIELKKSKRSGVILIMLIIGVFGALYVIANFVVRKDTLLALPLAPMDILLTQLYGIIAVINLFGIVAATCMIYQIEHSDNALKRMYTLPIKVTHLFGCKILILSVLLLISFGVQYGALGIIGNLHLPKNTFNLLVLIQYALYTFVTSLPVLLLMVFLSSRISNIWITLGIGVAGFFSGMATVLSDSVGFLINPFALIIRPATSTSAAIESPAIIISTIEIIVFLLAGFILTKKIRYE